MQDRFIKEIEQHQSVIHKVINLYVQNVFEKPDLYQEIVLQAWHSFPSFREASKFFTWLYRVSLNTAIAFVKKQKKRNFFFYKTSFDYVPDVPDSEDGENTAALYNLIAKLSPVDKALIMLYIDNIPYQEIASITGLTISNVGVKINRIKQYLKKEGKIYLKENYDGR